jgi:surface protein
MNNMFCGAESFNQPLNNWNVSNVIDMSYMFYHAISFNQPLNNWNVSNVIDVKDIDEIFVGAKAFNQDLSNWKLVSLNERILINKSTEIKEFESEKVCSICLNSEVNNYIIKMNCCGNNYHKNCIIKWLDLNKNCPLCRVQFD